MSESETAIEQHNARYLWEDAANHLRIAVECIERAQCALDDLNEPRMVGGLQPVAEAVGRFQTVAEGKSHE